MIPATERTFPQVIDRNFTRPLPWEPRDPRAILVKIAWFQLTGRACETVSLKPWSRKLVRKGLIARARLETGQVEITLTAAGRDYLLVSMLETTLGRPLIGASIQWAEAQYFKRLLTAADDDDEA